jgi:3-hydroxy-3-methylglutaryl CoA synthase
MTTDQTLSLPMVGIESLRLYTSPYYLDMDDFALARGEDADKFHTGL